MIGQDNFIALLESLGFAKNKSIYSNTIGTTSLSVDVTKQTINYPESDGLVVNKRQTCNFSANENFVVFECVHRLLEKGYKPEHIELEPKWKLGRGASGDRTDILINDNFGKPLLERHKPLVNPAEYYQAIQESTQKTDSTPFIAFMLRMILDTVSTSIPEVRLLSTLSGEMTRQEFKEALGLKDDEHFRKAYLLPALEAGLIEMTIPDKPRSSKQKYRLTDKGRRVMAQHGGG